MTTIQGSIAKLAGNSLAMFESLGYITSNIANYNTTAYKGQRFETYLNPDGTIGGVARTDSSSGALFATLRELDVAIDGAGYIPVTNKKGDTCYTRDGSFTVNSEGYLVTSDGWLVGSGIEVPANYKRLKIDEDGTIKVLPQKGGKFEKIGHIPVVIFNNPEGLEFLEGNKLKETKKSGEATIVLDHTKVKQGKVERSNINLHAQVGETLKINGSIMSSTRLIKALDEIYRESINLRQ